MLTEGEVAFLKKRGIPNWETLIGASPDLWKSAREKAVNGPSVLVATTVASITHATVLESTLAAALTLRGARVSMLLCQSALPACMRVESQDLPDPNVILNEGIEKILCSGCNLTGKLAYGPLDLPIHRLSAQIKPEVRADIARRVAGMSMKDLRDYTEGGLAVGDHAHAGTLRYFARGDLSAEPLGEAMQRKYLEASLLTVAGMQHLTSQHRFDAACFHHGIYVPQGLIGEVCREKGIRVANWNPAYRRNTFIFSHEDSYHHTMIKEPRQDWDGFDFTDDHERDICSYLMSRYSGSRDWIWFHEKPESNIAAFAAQHGLDLSKPIIGMLSNVMWDAQLHFKGTAFRSMLEWVLDTIKHFIERPDLQLLLRVHPAEIRGTAPSRQPLMAEIRKAFPTLPKNIVIIPPENPISTYAILPLCNAVIIFGTKTGMEINSIGIPVIVAGEAWVRNKGLSLDADSVESYHEILAKLPLPVDRNPDITRRSRKFAYHFFFRRMIPLPLMESVKSYPFFRLNVNSLEDLLPGRWPGLDIICDGIMHGSPFIYPAETLGIHDGQPG